MKELESLSHSKAHPMIIGVVESKYPKQGSVNAYPAYEMKYKKICYSSEPEREVDLSFLVTTYNRNLLIVLVCGIK